MNALYAAELFSGGGGLAIGLRNAGVRPVAAVELDEYAADTFEINHPDVTLFRADVRRVTGGQLSAASPTGLVDVLAACPPCQGFSTLTSKYKRDDGRNQLVSEVGRIAGEALPWAIMMENVPGLAGRGRPILDSLIKKLERLGYVTNVDVLQVADYGVPQQRKRLVVLAGLGFHISMPTPTHSKRATDDKLPWRTLRDAIGETSTPVRIDVAIENGGFESADWHVIRRLGEANTERLRAAQPGAARGSLPQNVRPACHQGDAGFTNSYGRMEWDRPSSTITAGCLSPSKGRFGHPEELRTISLREAALIQTFPPGFKFASDSIDRACSVVGNALPCVFAEQIANRVQSTVERCVPWVSPKLVAKREALRAKYSH